MPIKRGTKKSTKNKLNVSFFKKEISNKLAYTIISVFVLIIVGLGVYALSAGETPNPGHNIKDIGPPANCNGFLKFNGSDWLCEDISAGGDSVWRASGSNIYYNNGNVGIGKTIPGAKLDVNGSIQLTSDGADGPRIIFTSKDNPEWRVRNGWGTLGFFPGENQPTALSLVNNSGTIKVGILTNDPQGLFHVGPPPIPMCIGTANRCESFTSQTSCRAQSGCSWSMIEQDCTIYNDQNTCSSHLGCTWNSQSGCTGTTFIDTCQGIPKSCDSFTDESSCRAQSGCSWTPVHPHPFIIDNNGRVGIGTLNPNLKLEVVGNANISGDLYTTRTLYFGYEINEYRDSHYPPSSSILYAYCSPGKKVIGGGCHNDLTGKKIEISSPIWDGSGWACRFEGGAKIGKAYAICARVS
jgi:hypothetical protein